MKRAGWIVTLLIAMFLGPLPHAAAACDGNEISCNDGNGVQVGLTRGELQSLPKYPGQTGGAAQENPTVWFEYGMTTACTGAPPGSSTADVLCMHAVTSCSRQGALGPLMLVWRRQQGQAATDTTWHTIGETCVTDVIPGSGPPKPTIADIKRAFSLTPWSKPTVAMQPPNGQTLIGMPTYYSVDFPAAGFGPGEINRVTLLGYRVEVRPVLVGYIYTFGDGTSFGPTLSPGGPYPNGDIRHPYTKTGTMHPTVTVRYTGEFRIGTEPWARIPGTVDVSGPTASIVVREARAVLVNQLAG
jgi:hypothetical protein